MASIAVATRMATNRRNSTSWMRQSTYTPIPKPSTTRRRRATSAAGYVLTTTDLGRSTADPNELVVRSACQPMSMLS